MPVAAVHTNASFTLEPATRLALVPTTTEPSADTALATL
jgi:hypothetical protein